MDEPAVGYGELGLFSTLVEYGEFRHRGKYNRPLAPPQTTVRRTSEVIKRMSDGVFNPVIYRPLFDHLDLVTCRTYETFAANTIPLFKSDQKSSRTIYGNQVEELILGCDPKGKILDVINKPSYYFDIVKNIRNHLRINHSHKVRLLELIDMINL